jgi:hypothetical protein
VVQPARSQASRTREGKPPRPFPDQPGRGRKRPPAPAPKRCDHPLVTGHLRSTPDRTDPEQERTAAAAGLDRTGHWRSPLGQEAVAGRVTRKTRPSRPPTVDARELAWHGRAGGALLGAREVRATARHPTPNSASPIVVQELVQSGDHGVRPERCTRHCTPGAESSRSHDRK